MKVLVNPLKEELAIQYKGVNYTLEADGKMFLDSDEKLEAGIYWQEQIHQFLIMRTVSGAAVPKPKVEEPEKKEEVKTEETPKEPEVKEVKKEMPKTEPKDKKNKK